MYAYDIIESINDDYFLADELAVMYVRITLQVNHKHFTYKNAEPLLDMLVSYGAHFNKKRALELVKERIV